MYLGKNSFDYERGIRQVFGYVGRTASLYDEGSLVAYYGYLLAKGVVRFKSYSPFFVITELFTTFVPN